MQENENEVLFLAVKFIILIKLCGLWNKYNFLTINWHCLEYNVAEHENAMHVFNQCSVLCVLFCTDILHWLS